MYNEKEKLQNNNTISLLTSKSNSNTRRNSKSITEDIRIFYKKSRVQPRPVLQYVTDDEKIETILRLCYRHGYDVSESEAREYLWQMNMGLHPRIQNHNAIIRPWGNSFHVIQVRFGGSGTMGRVVEDGGAEAYITNTDNGYQIPSQYTMETIITSENLGSISPRENLASIMGGSAYERTQIQDSEYLHIIAHSLGGQDEQENLIPGYHALNTAMIPIENFVRYLATIGNGVYYRVQMHPRVGGNGIWVSGATMTVAFEYNGIQYTRSWDIEIGSQERLNSDDYNMLVQDIEAFKRTIGI